MFTLNYYQALCQTHISVEGITDLYGTKYYDIRTGYNVAFADANRRIITKYPAVSSSSTSVNGDGIIFGDGVITPTVDDYKLSGNVIATVELISRTVTIVELSNGYRTTTRFVVKNTGDIDITISEIGRIGTVAAYKSGTYYVPTLYERSLLETPVTIAPGASAQIDYIFYEPFG